MCAGEDYAADQGGEELDYGEAQAEYHEDETFAFDDGNVDAYEEEAIEGTCAVSAEMRWTRHIWQHPSVFRVLVHGAYEGDEGLDLA